MKKSFVLLIAVSALFFIFQSSVLMTSPGPNSPDEVKEVLEMSCYDCHSNAAKGDKPKSALNFDAWEDYKLSKKISKLDAISEVLIEGKMPPEKYLKGNPDKALADDQKKLLVTWTEEMTAKLMEVD